MAFLKTKNIILAEDNIDLYNIDVIILENPII